MTSTKKRSKEATDADGEHNKIVVYMGNGTIPADKMLKVIKSAFHATAYEVYIASAYLKEEKQDNINVAPRWDFDRLLKESVLFINHGGQNSITDGLLNGVPQIVVPGKIFERKYNAKSIADNKAGVVLKQQEFNSDSLRTVAEEIIRSGEMAGNALALGRKMMEAGGIDTIIQGCGI